MKAQLITIGYELLIGDTINTNAGWIGRYLTDNGIEVERIRMVGDDLEILKKTFQTCLRESDLVISTGGLGPTHDDVTKKALQELFDTDLVLHDRTLAHVRKIFSKRNLSLSESNYHQAEVLENCEVLFNKQGTAPGMWFDISGTRLAVLPGVPYEMKYLMKELVLPKIKESGGEIRPYNAKYLLTAGVTESTLSDRVIGDLKAFYSADRDVAYLPSPQGVRIRVSATGRTDDEARERTEELVELIRERAAIHIIGEGRELTLSEAVGNILKEHGLNIAVAESCTGGRLNDELTNIPGSSEYVLGGVIAYANRIKTQFLDVPEPLLKAEGAVSKPVALLMAENVAKKFDADIGVSTTGIAGPGGGTREKPVGTVWIGFWSRQQHFALKGLFTNDRLINKERSAAVALETVRRTILGIETMPYDLEKQT